jgi:hypothetical protein
MTDVQPKKQNADRQVIEIQEGAPSGAITALAIV